MNLQIFYGLFENAQSQASFQFVGLGKQGLCMYDLKTSFMNNSDAHPWLSTTLEAGTRTIKRKCSTNIYGTQAVHILAQFLPPPIMIKLLLLLLPTNPYDINYCLSERNPTLPKERVLFQSVHPAIGRNVGKTVIQLLAFKNSFTTIEFRYFSNTVLYTVIISANIC